MSTTKHAEVVGGYVKRVLMYTPGVAPGHLIPVTDATGPCDVGATWDGERFTPPAPSRYMTEDRARMRRHQKLAATDWVVARATETGEPVPPEWIEYRQALRDVPEQAGFPASINWPDRPLA